ncbi:MAG TPA: hypothetical protein VF044_07370 [Actinomycetota bacterium]
MQRDDTSEECPARGDRHDPAPRRGLRLHALAATVALLLAVAETWPMPTRMSTHFPADAAGRTEATHDQLLTSWMLASDVRRLGEDPLGVFHTNNMHPFRNTLAYSENLLGIAIAVWPVQVLWDDPVLTNNVALLFTIALSTYGVVLLVHELTGSLASALVAALLAAWNPWVWINVGQLHATAGQATPLALFALARLVRTGAWRFAAMLGVLAAWQVWASLHWGLFLALGLAGAAPVLLLTSRAARRALPQLVAAGVIAAVLVVPVALPYAGVARDMDVTDRGFVMGVYKPWNVVPALTDPLTHLALRLVTGSKNNMRLTLTPWLLMGAGLVAGLVLRRRCVVWRSMAVAVAAGGAVNFWYALGPVSWYGVPSLYSLMAEVPGLAIVRSAARAVAYTSVVAAVLAGCGLAALLARIPARAGRLALVAVVVALGIVEGGWRPGGLAAAPARRVPVPRPFARLPADCADAELPTSFERQALALFESTAHWRPVVNGRSGFYPVAIPVEIVHLNRFPQEPALEYLQAAGACAVVLHVSDPKGDWMMKASRGQGLDTRPLAPFQWLVHLPPAASPPDPPALDRATWRVREPAAGGTLMLDDSLATMVELDATRAERLVVDLGRRAVVSGVDLALGRRFRRHLWTYRIEGSPDGAVWTTLAERPVALPPFESYRADPTRIVQRIRFPEAELSFLRVGPYRVPKTGFSIDATFTTWGVAELGVRGRPAE